MPLAANRHSAKGFQHMFSTAVLSTCERFYVLSCVPPSGEGVIVKRKKGYISFLNEDNAEKMAKRLSAKNPGTRYYVLGSLSGHFLPKVVTQQSARYA